MAESNAVAKIPEDISQLDTSQTNQACKVLLKHIAQNSKTENSPGSKPNLLAVDESSASDEDDYSHKSDADIPIWLILSTKKHITDQKRLKPNKILLPNPIHNSQFSTICLITADPQNTYSTLVDNPSFPTPLRSRITRVVSLTHLKKDYKSFESRRKLFAEHDIFLADDRIVTYLPHLLGKSFYKGGSKRPIPISISAPKERDENGKRIKIDPASGRKANPDKIEGGRGARSPDQVAKEIEKALNSALVNLAPAATTAIKVARADFTPDMVQQNIEAVVNELVAKFVPMGWKNVRALHIKSPNSMSFPIWLASELWADEGDVLEEPKKLGNKGKKTKAKQKAIEGTDSAENKASPSIKRKSEQTSKPKEDKHTKKKRRLIVSDDRQATEESSRRKQKLNKQKADAFAEGL